MQKRKKKSGTSASENEKTNLHRNPEGGAGEGVREPHRVEGMLDGACPPLVPSAHRVLETHNGTSRPEVIYMARLSEDQDSPHAVARLAEQVIGLQRQIDHLHRQLAQSSASLSELTDAKFVTYRTLIDSQAEKVALALSASEKAIGKAEQATEKRFDAVNEFRAQLSDQARTFMPRTEADTVIAGVTTRVRELTATVSESMTRAEAVSLSDRNGERIQELTDRMNRNDGQVKGKTENRAGLYAAIGTVGVLLSIVVVVANFLAGS